MKKSEQEEKIIGTINERVKSAESFLTPYVENWTRYYKLFRSFIDDDKWPTHSKIFNPYIWSAIETQTSKSIASKPNGEFKPANPETNIDKDKMALAFDDWWRKELMNFKAQSTFKKGMIYGTTMSRIVWEFKMGNKGGKRQVIIDRPHVRLMRLEDMMVGFDTTPDEERGIGWIYEKFYMTKKELEDIRDSVSAPLYQNLKKAIKNFEDNEFPQSAYKEDKMNVSGASSVKDTTVKKVKCIYMEDLNEGKIYFLVGEKTLIQNIPNPFLFETSFIIATNSIVPSEILGMSDVEPTERLQHGLNVIQNERRDNVQAVLKHQWIVGDDAEIDDDELVDELNGIIHAKDVNKIKPNVKPNVTSSAYQEEASIKADIQQALSVTNYSKGSDEVDNSRSGVAIERLQGAADARVRTKLELFEIQYVKSVAEKWQRLMAQRQKDPIVVEDGGEFISITPEELGAESGEASYYVESGSTKHTDPYQTREEFSAYMDKLLALADRKRMELKEQGDATAMQGQQPQIDPKTGMPLPQQPTAPPVPSVIDYDKMAEELSETFGQKNWRQYWIMAEEETQQSPQEPQEEMLPGVDEERRPMEQGDMLPAVDDDGQQQQPQQEEMLPGIDQEEMLPRVTA